MNTYLLGALCAAIAVFLSSAASATMVKVVHQNVLTCDTPFVPTKVGGLVVSPFPAGERIDAKSRTFLAPVIVGVRFKEETTS